MADSTTEPVTTDEEVTQPAAPQPVKPKYRHDWYQTTSEVRVNIMIKGLKKEQVSLSCEDRELRVSINLGEENFDLNLKLAHAINADKTITKVLGTKVELVLRKREMLQWTSLEDTGATQPSSKSNSLVKDEGVTHKYPSSAHYTRNWDKLEADVKKEEKEEKPEGDEALNKLFKQIYADGNEEVKKAMNKSFQESGGTVLSTNWSEINKGKVERKPPDGMEWKEYEK